MRSEFLPATINNKVTAKPIVIDRPKRKDWPLWAIVISKLRNDRDKGVGSTVERVIGTNNSLAFKTWFTATFGRKCGCSERKEKWDLEYNYLQLPNPTDTI